LHAGKIRLVKYKRKRCLAVKKAFRHLVQIDHLRNPYMVPVYFLKRLTQCRIQGIPRHPQGFPTGKDYAVLAVGMMTLLIKIRATQGRLTVYFGQITIYESNILILYNLAIGIEMLNKDPGKKQIPIVVPFKGTNEQ